MTGSALRRAGAILPAGRSQSLMLWLIAVMTFLTALGVAGGIGLGHAARGLAASLGRTITVQVVEANPDVRARQADAVLALVRQTPGIAKATPIDRAQLQELLEPWLGSGNLSPDLPLPALIDVELMPGRRSILPALGEAIRRVAPAARIDDQADWLGPIAGLLEALQLLAAAIVVLLFGATVATVVLTTRAGLNTHRSTLDVMHLMGAEDAQIAGLFQRRLGLDGLIGGLLGLAVAVLVILMVGARTAAIGSSLLGTMALPAWAWAMIILLPFAAASLAMLTARLTVLSALRRSL